MKPTSFLTVALVLLGLVAMVNAAGTPAGEEITNQAQGSYNDANGNEVAGSTEGYLMSNIVSTIVSQVAGADLGNDQAQNISALSSTLYQVIFTNPGNGTDTFALSAGDGAGQSGSYTYEIYSDNTGTVGVIDGTDAIVTSTGALAADSTFNIIVKITDTTVGGADEGDVLVVTLTALSGFNGGVSDATVLTTTVQAATVAATITSDTPSPQPGDVITYSVCITNNGTAVAYNVLFTNLIPDNVTYNTETIYIGTTGWANGTHITDEVGGTPDAGDFGQTTANTITVNLGNIAAGGGSMCVYYKVTVIAGTPEGATIDNAPEVDFENEGAVPYPTVDPTGDTSISVAESFSVDIDSTGTTSFIGDPSDSLFYSFTVQNLGNGTDFFNLTVDAYDYVIWTFYADDGDGELSTAELSVATVTFTGALTQNGIAYFVAVGIIEPGTADAAADATTFKATSDGDAGAFDTVTASATCTAPILTLVKTVSPTGNQPPGTTLTYQVLVANSGTGTAASIVVSDVIPTFTTYVAESMTIDGSAQGVITDASDGDGGTLSGGSIVFEFSTLDESGGTTDTHTLTFEVTIDN
ncbi:DUF11 domain-containing protein [bacterium]|nr:DUF11 domain-containing protein [bacterium]